ncbi:hypothetical protein WH95_19025 [Kiloniella litopenaei]|uniref:ABC transporter substrate-binding protein n=1 Tax=Kiloniella litopenaei TaxID=1549748 RepID=A0A0M2R4F3_9PROT|nr:hypothetical protein WH95_19025 [Kiloniella litopenaei]
MRWIKRSWRQVFRTSLLLILFYPSYAQSHPHVWVDAAVIIHRNDAGEISALEPVWIFDDLYTASLLPDLDQDQSGEVEKAELLTFARDAIGNLQEWDYFLKVKRDDEFGPLYRKEIIADADVLNNRLLLRFKLDLEKPVALGTSVQMQMYDPSYFIAMDVIENHAVSYLPAAMNACTHSVTHPDDNLEDGTTLSDLVFSDEEVAQNPDLGSIFAKTVTVTC